MPLVYYTVTFSVYRFFGRGFPIFFLSMRFLDAELGGYV